MSAASKVRVECYEGYRGQETPRRFYVRERPVEVLEVVDRWLSPDRRYFKLQTVDGTYILRHDTGADAWDLASFTARPQEIPSAGDRSSDS